MVVVMALFVVLVKVMTLSVVGLSIVQECYILVQVQAPKSEIHSFSPPELKIWDRKEYLHEK